MSHSMFETSLKKQNWTSTAFRPKVGFWRGLKKLANWTDTKFQNNVDFIDKDENNTRKKVIAILVCLFLI